MFRGFPLRLFQAKMGDLPEVRPPCFHMLYDSVTQYKHSTITIDCQHLKVPMVTAMYLLWSTPNQIEKELHAAFIDNSTTDVLPCLDQEIENKEKNEGLTYENIKYLILTNTRLEHTGATGALLRTCPNATVLCHPKAVSHLLNPESRIQEAKQQCGESLFSSHYGQIHPCEPRRVRAVQDNEVLEFFPERPLHFFHVKGLDNDSMLVWDQKTRSIFTGDAFGMHYPWLELYNVRRPLFFPSIPPKDFETEKCCKVIDRIVALQPRRTYLAHYGMLENIENVSVQLKEGFETYTKIQKELITRLKSFPNPEKRDSKQEQELLRWGEEQIRKWTEEKLRNEGLANDDTDFWNFWKAEIARNARSLFLSAKRISVSSGIKNENVESSTKETSRSTSEKPDNLVHATDASLDTASTPMHPESSFPSLSLKKPLEDMTIHDLQRTFREFGLERYTDILRIEEIDGFLFRNMDPTEIRQVFPSLSYGAWLRLKLLLDNDKKLEVKGTRKAL